MATPQSENIIDDMIAALKLIKKQAGYHNDVAWVGRRNAQRDDAGPGTLRPCVEVAFGGEAGGHPGQARILTRPRVIVRALIDYDDSLPAGPDEQANNLGFDIMRAVTEMSLGEKAYLLQEWDREPIGMSDPGVTEDGTLITFTWEVVVKSTEIGTAYQ